MDLLLKDILFTLLVPGVVAGIVPMCFSRGGAASGGLMLVLSVLLFLFGGAIYAWCVWHFATFGRGTPAPIDPPRRLVVRGPYQYTRNPMYVALLIVLFGWLALFRGWALLVYTCCVAAGFHLWVMLFEEPRLERRFGAGYREYCARVNRWLPRLL